MRKQYKKAAGGFLLALVLAAGCGKAGQQENAEETEPQEIAEEEAAADGAVIWQGEQYQYNDHLSNFLFLGIDTRERMETRTGQADAGQSDALYLVSYDRVEKSVKLISIPRDTMTQIEVFDKAGGSLGLTEDHISLAYAYGDGGYESCRLAEEAVSRLFYGIPIQGTSSLSLDGIPALLECVGNIDVVVPNDSLEKKDPEMKQGATVTVTPENAETFVRYRDVETHESAVARMERQQVFLAALGEKVRESLASDPGLVGSMYQKLKPYMTGTIHNDWFAKLAEALGNEADSESWTVPGESSFDGEFDEYRIDDSAFYEKVLETFYKKVE